MKRFLFIFAVCLCCNKIHAQDFSITDNLLLTEISKEQHHNMAIKANKSINMKYKYKGKKAERLFTNFINTDFGRKLQYCGEDIRDDFSYIELPKFHGRRYYLIDISTPVSSSSYLMNDRYEIDTTEMFGGILSKDFILYSYKECDCDCQVWIKWYSLKDYKVEQIAELKSSFDFELGTYDDLNPSFFIDDKGYYYFMIINKLNSICKYYKISLRSIK